MTLIQRIRQDRNEARKYNSKDRYDTLTVLLSESEKIGKNSGNRESTDEEVIQVTKKMINVCKDTLQMIQATPDNPRKKELENRWKSEIEVYENYIPKQLDESSLTLIIGEIIKTKNIDNPRDIGIVMAGLKAKFSGQYDGKIASTIAKKMLL